MNERKQELWNRKTVPVPFLEEILSSTGVNKETAVKNKNFSH